MTNNSIIRTKGYISVKPTQHYTITRNITTGYINVRGYNKNKQFVGAGGDVITLISGSSAGNPMDIGKNICIIAPKDNIYYLRFNDSSNDLNTQFMMVKGDTSSDYIPYQEQTFTFPLGNEKLMLGDYLADDGIHHVRGQTELTIDNINLVYEYNANPFNKNVPMIRIRKIALGMEVSYYSSCIFNNYHNITEVAKVESGAFTYNFDNNNIYVFDERFTDLATARQLLIGTVIEYELQEEVIVPYTSAQQEVYNQIKQALSYEEQTNISSNTIALFNVEAYQSTKLVLEEMATAIVALGGV